MATQTPIFHRQFHTNQHKSTQIHTNLHINCKGFKLYFKKATQNNNNFFSQAQNKNQIALSSAFFNAVLKLTRRVNGNLNSTF